MIQWAPTKDKTIMIKPYCKNLTLVHTSSWQILEYTLFSPWDMYLANYIQVCMFFATQLVAPFAAPQWLTFFGYLPDELSIDLDRVELIVIQISRKYDLNATKIPLQYWKHFQKLIWIQLQFGSDFAHRWSRQQLARQISQMLRPIPEVSP